MRVRIAYALLTGALSVVLPALSRADVVYNNLGAGDTYNCCSAWVIGDPDFVPAFAFTPGATYDLTQIDLGLGWSTGTNQVTVNLLNDSSNKPGALIESWTLTNLPGFGTTSNTLQSVTPIGLVQLLSGTQYWIQLEPADASTFAVWNNNSTGATGHIYDTGNGSVVHDDTQTFGALRVLGDPASAVPEPGYVVLPCAALLLGLIVRRQRNAANSRQS